MWFGFLVVQEAVQFCVTVCEFSVANSVSGVRKMLPLVWSTDAAIKDAVVQAYRRLYLNPQGDAIRCVKKLDMYLTILRALTYITKHILDLGPKIYCDINISKQYYIMQVISKKKHFFCGLFFNSSYLIVY